MQSTKLVLKKSSTRKDGTTPIFIQYSYDRERRTLLHTRKYIKSNFWNYEKNEVRRTHPDAKDLNLYIQTLHKRVDNLIDDAIMHKIDPSIDYIKNKYQDEIILKKKEQSKDFFDQLDLFIEDAIPRVTDSVIKQHRSLKNHLLNFKKQTHFDLCFNSVNYDFYLKFKKYLEHDVVKPDGEKGLAINTVGKQIKNLKTFIRNCIKREIIPYIDLSDLKAETEEVENIYLNEEEIQSIAQLDLAKDLVMGKCRDLFLIGCETGLRFSDFSKLQPQNIKGKFIWKRTQKTHRQVVIPISSLLKGILDKYENTPPTDASLQVFNRYIKLVGEMAGIHDEIITVRKKGNTKVKEIHYKFELISSHTCRRSFCTNQFHKGMPSLLIRKISGHKTEAAFLKYIKVNEEAAAKKMLEYWNQS